MNITEILTPLIAAGGLGYINYLIADKLGLINYVKGRENLAILFMLSWSVPDFSIYLLIRWILGLFKFLSADIEMILSLILSIFAVYIFSLLFLKKIFAVSNFFLNKVRKSLNLGSVSPISPWMGNFGNDTKQTVFIYSLQKDPIICGDLETISNLEEESSMILRPFPDIKKMPTFEELMEKVSEIDYQKENKVRQYINYDKKIIIVSIE